MIQEVNAPSPYVLRVAEVESLPHFLGLNLQMTQRKFVNTTKSLLMKAFGEQSGSTCSTALLLCSFSRSPCSFKSIKGYLQQL